MTPSRSDVAPVTVVLPTIGRARLIRPCLESLAACEPRAAETLVVDSSVDGEVERVVAEFSGMGARTIHCDQPGLGTAFNLGLTQSRHEIVLLTNDDCTVDPSWVGVGLDFVEKDGRAIISGRVRPHGDPELVPSTIDDPVPREHVGKPDFVLYTQCMAFRRSPVLEFGGFDGRIRPTAEDNDLSYRWLRAGQVIRYEPDFVVWHHDWRTRSELDQMYVRYAVGQGMLYAKYLWQGDLVIARYVARDLYFGLLTLAARVRHGKPALPNWGQGILRGLPVGLARGFRTFRPRRDHRRPT